WVGTAAAASMRRELAEARAAAEAEPRRKPRLAVGPGLPTGQAGTWGDEGDEGEEGDEEEDEEEDDDEEYEEELPIPSASPNVGPMSATFAPARSGGRAAAALLAERALDDVTVAGDSPQPDEEDEYVLPPLELLDDV